MDDFDSFSCNDGYSHSASYCAPAADPYLASYNPCTIDPVAIMIRNQREEEERNRYQAERGQGWASSAPPSYAPSSGWDSRPATTGRPTESCDNDDYDWANSPARRALAAGQKYYYLPGEPKTWRRPVSTPSGKYDAQWWKMFANADEISMYLAERLGYIGARDEDGWIRPTCWELLRMDFWTVQQYAFYYAEFAEEFKRKIPRWVEFLRPMRTHVSSDEFWA